MPYFPNINHNKNSNKMSSNTSLDNTSDQDYTEFLNEYLLQTNSNNNEPEIRYEDGEMEAEWLISAGYPQLTKPFEQGLEVHNSELEHIISTLPKPHAEAIKQRVRALNHTVRGRTKNRSKRKPDIRDVFRDFDESSTGTRSRSATPDSLDSIHADEVWGNASIPSFVSIFDHCNGNEVIAHVQQSLSKNLKQRLRRTPSAPIKGSTDIFRGSHMRCDIPHPSVDGVELLNFSRIGTMHPQRNRSGSDPSCSVGRERGELMQDSHSDNNTSSSDSSDECVSTTARLSNVSSPEKILNKIHLDTPPQSVQNSPSSRDGISFENMFREASSQDCVDTVDSSDKSLECYTEIDTMNEIELKRLQPILWLELASVFDRNNVTLDKIKPSKRRRKEEGNLFGVSLNALIRRDQQITGKDSTLVPLFLEGLLAELTKRGAKEEGILRVGGHKQKTELLRNELESSFYQKPQKFAQILRSASVHELSNLLKRWLRELPQPLLSSELVRLFYQCYMLPPNDQIKALSTACQLLPHENRNTLRSLLRFLNHIIDLQDFNKMNVNNVATIIAPSLFPPNQLDPTGKVSAMQQVKMAALCCRLANVLLRRGEALFQVPNHLIEESRNNNNKPHQGKRAVVLKRVKESTSLLHIGNGNSGNNNSNVKNTTNISVTVSSTPVSRQQSINPSHVHRLIV